MVSARAEIISIGNEVLAGYTVNTNATFISQQLLGIGLPVKWVTTISDTHEEIVGALKTAASRAQVIMVTGGLGPTPDDITKKAICDFFKVDMRFDEATLKYVEDFLRSRNVELTEINRDQALVPNCEHIFPNSNGTAPGLGFVRGDRYFFFMPGVPGEMKAIMQEHLLKFLSHNLQLPSVHTLLQRTTGIPESRLYEKLQHLVEAHPEIQISFLPRYIGVDLRYRFISDEPHADRVLATFADEVRKIAGRYIFSEQNIELEEVVGELLKRSAYTLATGESFTGGLLADLITNIPGSSAYFLSGFVTYSNESKIQFLGVNPKTIKNHGAVSAETAEEMVHGLLKQADCAIATTGIAGPGGNTKSKPVGLCYIAAAVKGKTNVKEFHFGKDRLINKKRGAVAGLEMLRRLLLDL